MKSTFILIASITSAFQAGAAESAIPGAFPAERYEAMVAKSPFALATPPAPVAAPPEKNFADGWYVSGLAQLDGKDFVTIKSRDLAVQLSLYGTDPKDGVSVQKVEWSPAIGRSTVTIAKDGQTAKLEFNQAELQSSAGAPAPGAMPAPSARSLPSPQGTAKPGVPRPNQPIVQPQNQPQQYGGLPNLNGVVPRANGAIVPSATPDNRRRIRVINNVPAQ